MVRYLGFPTSLYLEAIPDPQDESPTRCATIRVQEHPDGVFIDVADGTSNRIPFDPAMRPIGPPVHEFVEHLADEVAHPIAPIEPGFPDGDPLPGDRGRRLIHYEAFDGTLYDFHRLMLRLQNRCPEGWPPKGRKRLVFRKATVDPASYYFHYWVELRASVRRPIRPKPCARIRIYRNLGILLVDFEDSVDAREELPASIVCPIGRLFEEFCKFVVDEIRSPLVPLRTPAPLKSLSNHAVARYDDIIHREPLLEDSSYPRGRMAGILHGCLKAWQSGDRPRLKLSTIGGPTDISLEKCWLKPVVPLGDDTNQHACIVVERLGDPKVLNFLDGVGPPGSDDRQTEPIGRPFEEFCAFVVEAVRSGTLPSYDEPLDGDKRDDSPLSQAALFLSNLDDFRRLVDSLVCEDSDEWLASDGTRLQLNLGPISPGGDGQRPYCWVQIAVVSDGHHTGHYATLKAEEEDGQTLLTFRDAHRWQHSPTSAEEPKALGSVLAEFRRDILKEMELFRFRELDQTEVDEAERYDESSPSAYPADGESVDGEAPTSETSGPQAPSRRPSLREALNTIPDRGYDHRLLKMFYAGMRYREIAEVLHRDEKTIRNRLCELRGIYGEEIVPLRRKRSNKYE
jgi:hypothetical protein